MHINTHFLEEIFMHTFDLLSIPRNLMKKFIVLIVLNFFSTVLLDGLTFFMHFSKEAISHGKIVLSLFFIAIYYLRTPIGRFSDSLVADFREILQEEKKILLKERTCETLYRVKGKVLYKNDSNGYEEKMPTSKIFSTIQEYIDLTWEKRIFLLSNLPNIVSTIVLFFSLILTSTSEIENTTLFTLLLILSIITEYFFSNYKIKKNSVYEEKNEKIRSIREEAKQNVFQINSYFDKQAKYRTKSYIEACVHELKNDVEFAKTRRITAFGLTLCHSLFTLLVIILSVFEKGIDNTSLETLISAIAIATIYEHFIHKIAILFSTRTSYEELLNRLKPLEPHFQNINDVYIYEMRNETLPLTKVRSIHLPAFSVSYKASQEKDPYSLHSFNDFTFVPGDFVILTGDSGSGKTTFMKIITEELHFPSISLKIKTVSEGRIKNVFHGNENSIGSKSVLEEITLGQSDFNKDKLIRILQALHLYDELAPRCDDIFEYLANVSVSQFSDGQVQRLALACSLFNIDEEHQVIALDETTNKLNNEIALNVLEYIKKYCSDRIVLLATHQVDVAQKVANRQLTFIKSDNSSYFCVTEIS